MPKLHQYDYIFAIGVIFCALDAYNIGEHPATLPLATC